MIWRLMGTLSNRMLKRYSSSFVEKKHSHLTQRRLNMIVEYIRYRINKEKGEQFVQDYARAAKSLDKSQFCDGYELTQCSEDKEMFVLRILWKSTEAHLNGFRKSPEFATFFADIKPYFNDILEMKHYDFTNVLAKKMQINPVTAQPQGVVEYIRYKINSARAGKFIEDYTRAANSLDKSQFCNEYELTQCSEDKEMFMLRILWKSTEAHLNGFRKSPEFTSFFADIKPYFNDILEMQHYDFTSVVAEKLQVNQQSEQTTGSYSYHQVSHQWLSVPKHETVDDTSTIPSNADNSTLSK